MSHHAAKSAAQPNSSLKAPRVASVNCQARTEVCSKPSLHGALAAHEKAAVEANLRRRGTEVTWCIGEPSVSYPVLCSGSRFGAKTGARRHGVVLLRLRRPCGVSVPPKRSLKTAATNAAQTSFGPRQESTPWHLGAGPTRLASPV
jgi:hypothetical protein